MFDLGIQEIIVIFVVALLIFGPDKLPELARNMGKGIGHLKKAMFDVKTEVEKEIKGAEKDIKVEVPSWKENISSVLKENEAKPDNDKSTGKEKPESSVNNDNR